LIGDEVLSNDGGERSAAVSEASTVDGQSNEASDEERSGDELQLTNIDDESSVEDEPSGIGESSDDEESVEDFSLIDADTLLDGNAAGGKSSLVRVANSSSDEEGYSATKNERSNNSSSRVDQFEKTGATAGSSNAKQKSLTPSSAAATSTASKRQNDDVGSLSSSSDDLPLSALVQQQSKKSSSATKKTSSTTATGAANATRKKRRRVRRVEGDKNRGSTSTVANVNADEQQTQRDVLSIPSIGGAGLTSGFPLLRAQDVLLLGRQQTDTPVHVCQGCSLPIFLYARVYPCCHMSCNACAESAHKCIM
jgi:hypothetical protein